MTGPLYLSYEELKELLNSEMAHGTDGRVIRYDKKHLIKLYHEMIIKLKLLESSKNDDIKVYKKEELKLARSYSLINFYQGETNSDYVKIRSKYAIERAILRQENIKGTKLPQQPVYVDGKFAGCVLIYQKGIQIHKLTGLPFEVKRRIMIQTLNNVKELIDNNVYHIDLDNSPFSKKALFKNDSGNIESVGHSHVLVNPITLNPQIIDLDGKSTIYTDYKSETLEKKSLSSLTNLMIEFLLSIDLDEYEDEDLEMIFKNIGIPSENIDNLVSRDMNYEQLNSFIKEVKKVKKI